MRAGQFGPKDSVEVLAFDLLFYPLLAVASVSGAMDGDVAVANVPLSLIAIPAESGPVPDAKSPHGSHSSSVDISTSVSPSSSTDTPPHDPSSHDDMHASPKTTETPAHSALVAASEDVPPGQMDAQPSAAGLDDGVLDVSGQVELMDQHSATVAVADGTVTIVEEGQDWPQETESNEMKRVKVSCPSASFTVLSACPLLTGGPRLDAHHINVNRCISSWRPAG